MKLNDWTIFLDSKKRVDLKKGNVKVGLCGKKNMDEKRIVSIGTGGSIGCCSF